MTKNQRLLTIENIPYLLECFDISRIDEGVLIWKERPLRHFKNEAAWKSYNTRVKGTEAGKKPRGNNYCTVTMTDPNTKETVYINKHRLIWLLKYNELPPATIDHRNRVTIDNRPSNLRSVTETENRRNSIAHNQCKGSGEIIPLDDGRYKVIFKHPEMTDTILTLDNHFLAFTALNYLSYLSESVEFLESIGGV